MSLADRAPLPPPTGPLTEALFDALHGPPAPLPELPEPQGDPLDDLDHHLALYACCELGYRGWAGVDAEWEWEPTLVGLRRELERRFEAAVVLGVAELPEPPGGDVPQRLEGLIAADDSPSVAQHLARAGDREQMRELLVHRSADRLKETEPHLRAIARLPDRPKAAIVEILADEMGGGRPERLHSHLFRQTMEALGLDGRENAYVAQLPGVTLATVNVMSLFGAHARLRGALAGHLAVTEMTSSVASRRYGQAMRRAGFTSRKATHYFDEHVEADAVHDVIASHELAGGLAEAEPELADSILFGARALMLLEGRLARYLLGAWKADQTSLRAPASAVV
jgi:hypothetical protein